jgi:hypothetical protein
MPLGGPPGTVHRRADPVQGTARALSTSSIFLGKVLILLDSNRSGIKPGALHFRPRLLRTRMAAAAGSVV